MQLTQMPKIQTLMPALCGLALTLAIAPLATTATAQGLFSPVITVNEQVITRFELEQRAGLLQLLRAPGNPEALAREALIEDRLKLQAVKDAGIAITSEDIEAGLDELAGRTNLSTEEFIAAVEQGGVAVQTLRDFAEVNVAWRDLIRARFLAQSRPTDTEIDRAMGSQGGGSGVRVLLSEIIIPVTPQTTEQVDDLAQQIAQVKGYDAFSQAASQYSAAQTRANGGRMNWLDLNTLPPGLRPLILELTPGEVTDPIALPDAVALFQMRGIQESTLAAPKYAEIEYATYYIPGGRTPEALSTAARIAQEVDTCKDLYGLNKGQSPERLQVVTQKPGEIPRDIATELAKLDEYEVSTALTRSGGQTLVFLMLCGRTAQLNQDASREDVANALISQRLTAFAQSYLDQLRADAVIVAK
ncbi:periplasmic chaperone for outer membrane proteins SurA [Sedimentitalea nanhaiensis]|uniref:Parvulin-like PPIase n=2 Tax=Sedimentitalea nanhaiensis TaxID=999627 RepID=A0A1I7AP44_9RHOB|nr:periplasmic chaperone for outer membrane proteins SurA [Sedimentitalea nanhaiensis]